MSQSHEFDVVDESMIFESGGALIRLLFLIARNIHFTL